MNHPSQTVLNAFGNGRLDDAEASSILLHLETCTDCRTVVENLDDDSLVSLLRTQTTTVPAGWDQARFAEIEAALAAHPRYELMELLGVGGMGAVFKARHKLMDRLVALKVLRPDLMAQPEAVERFEREVKTAAKLAHPNIVASYDADRAGDLHFLVMEYVPGTTLAALVAAQGRLSIQDACSHVRQAAIGLEYAARHGMVHRDLKPGNLMLAPDGAIKILDFGLARFGQENEFRALDSNPTGNQQLSQTGIVLGTADYLAPEQFRDASSADTRADLYSLGCTLFHLLNGRPPFPGGTVAAKAEAHAHRQPPSVRDSRPEVPPALDRLIHRLLEKDPAERIQTPAQLAEALGAFAQPPSTRRTYRRWQVAAAAVLLVIVSWLATAWGPSIYRFVTDQGVVIVETDDPDVEVIVKQRGEQIHLLDGKTRRQVTLTSGAYHLELTPGQDGLRLEVDSFTLKRGDKAIVRVWRDSAPIPADPDRHAAEWVLRVGGQIQALAVDNTLRPCSRIRDLPAGPLQLHSVDLTGRRNIRDADLGNLRGSATRELLLEGTPIGDAGLAHAKDLKRLVVLGLNNTNVTDSGLKHLAGLPVQQLNLSETSLGDAGLIHVGRILTLQELSVGTGVTDEGLQHLAGLADLHSLWLNHSQVTGVGLRHLSRLPRLTRLLLHRCPLKREGFAQLKAFRELTILDLGRTPVCDDDLADVGALTGLKELGLFDTAVRDEGLAHLRQLKMLEALDLHATRITGPGLRKLVTLGSLKQLKLTEVRLQDEDLVHLGALKALQSLELQSTGISGTGLSHLKNVPLERLSLAANPIRAAALEVLTQMPKLRWLELTGTGVSEETVKSMRDRLPNCEVVDLRREAAPMPTDPDRHAAEWVLRQGGRIGVFAADNNLLWCSRIDELPAGPFRLHQVVLNNCRKLTDEGLSNLRGCALHAIELDVTPITNAGLAQLRGVRQLNVLFLTSTHVTDEGLKHLEGTPLQRLRLDSTEVGNAGLLHLTGLHGLEELSLGKKVTDDGLVHLKRLTNLHSLWITKSQVTGSGLRHLASLRRLTRLDLDGSQIDNQGLADIRELADLQVLGLARTLIDHQGLAHVRSLTRLRGLTLHGAKVGDGGLPHLQDLKSLEYLDLTATKISGDGLRALRGMTSLKELKLGGVELDDEDLLHLGGLTALEALDLQSTKVNGSGLRHLKALPLQRLSLARNPLKPATLDALIHVPTLRWLELTESVSDGDVKSLRERFPNCEIYYVK